MRISIVNITKRIQVDLLTSTEYKSKIGIDPNTFNYSAATSATNTLWLKTWSGLMSGGSSVSNTTLKALNTNGTFFAGNSWGPTTFSISFGVLNDSAFQRLNECIKYKNEPLYIEVETDKTYYMWCTVRDGSSIENGELTFESALDGTGTYWSAGDKIFDWNVDAGYGLVQSGAQSILGRPRHTALNTGIDRYIWQQFITAEQLPIIKIHVPFQASFVLTHINSGVVYVSDDEAPAGPSDYVFDSRARTITRNGESFPNDMTDFVMLTGGEEIFELQLAKGTDITDWTMTLTVEDLYSTVYGG